MLTRIGLLTASVTVSDDTITVTAPLCYDEEIVVETGSWTFPLSHTVDYAIEDVYTANFEAWCRRKDEERAKLAAERPQPRRVPYGIDTRVHTPCPALWAGR